MSYLQPQKHYLVISERLKAETEVVDSDKGISFQSKGRVELEVVRPLTMRDSFQEAKEAAHNLLRDDLGVRAVYVVKVEVVGERKVEFDDGYPKAMPK